MQRLIVSLMIIASLAGVACAVAPTPVPPPAPTPTPITITHELKIIADPSEAADVLLNPTPIEGGRYVRGRTVTIDILPKQGWQVDRWAGPVYDEVGVSAKIDMNSSHTVIVRLVRVIAVPPTAAPSTLAPSATVRATAMPPASVPPTLTPETTPTPVRTLTPVPTASTDANNLPALLPTLSDIAPGAIIDVDGYVQDTNALLAY